MIDWNILGWTCFVVSVLAHLLRTDWRDPKTWDGSHSDAWEPPMPPVRPPAPKGPVEPSVMPQIYLTPDEVVDMLEQAERLSYQDAAILRGNKLEDVPEGMLVLQMSDTLALQIAASIRSWGPYTFEE